MSRNARKKDPAMPSKLNIELNTKNVALRVVLLAGFVLLAVWAFGTGIHDSLQPKAGWQQIEPANPETGISQDVLLCYNVGWTEQSTGAEVKAVSATYGEALEHGYRVLSNQPFEGYVNLYTLNSQPNTAISVDPLLYAAFETVEASGSRLPYFAPMEEQYRSLFASTYDSEAEVFDPARCEEAKQFAREIAMFAADSESVQVKLLPGNTLRLEVSPAYLDYARENGVESFVDFGMVLNAFLCDAAADALQEQGLVNGYVTSFDGYARALCSEEFGLNLFRLADGKPEQLGTVLYNGPCAMVSCRSFPVLEGDGVNYYTYSDGTILAPYINRAGELHTASSGLSTCSRELSTAELALRTLDAYAGEDSTFSILEDLSWVSVVGDEIHYHGQAFRPAE